MVSVYRLINTCRKVPLQINFLIHGVTVTIDFKDSLNIVFKEIGLFINIDVLLTVFISH
jgi:hypothetical protein